MVARQDDLNFKFQPQRHCSVSSIGYARDSIERLIYLLFIFLYCSGLVLRVYGRTRLTSGSAAQRSAHGSNGVACARINWPGLQLFIVCYGLLLWCCRAAEVDYPALFAGAVSQCTCTFRRLAGWLLLDEKATRQFRLWCKATVKPL